MTVADLLNHGMQLLKDGQPAAAERILLGVLAVDARNAHGHFALGIACYQMNRLSDAERYLSETISISPDFLPAYNNLGLVLNAMGSPERGMAILLRALAMQPGYVDAIYNLGLIQEENGDRAGAMHAYKRVVEIRPDFLRAHTNLGLLLRADGETSAAHRHLEIAATQQPHDVIAHINLALILTDLGRYAEAISSCERALQLEPDNFSAWEALGNAQRLAGDANNAAISLRRALALNPTSVVLQYELGLAQTAAGDLEAGRVTLNSVVRARPDWLKAVFTRDLALPMLYESDQHIADSHAGFMTGLANIEARLFGDDWPVPEAVEAVSGYAPFYLHYQGLDNTTLQQRFGRIVETVTKRAWPQFASPVPWKTQSHGGKLRVGFVSAYLRRHSVGLFFGNWICQLDVQKFESFVWYTGEASDSVTENIRAHSVHFAHVASDIDAVAHAIHASRLDVLIYLDVGMHPHSQVLASLKLAPIQCATFGHPVTSGLAGVDFFLSAEGAEPDVAQQHYTERLIRLPRFAISYARPDISRLRTPTPLTNSQRPFVLCAQPLFKLLPHFDDVVARIARELPGCRLAFVESLWPMVNQSFISRLSGVLRKAGVDPEKTLEMLPIMPFDNYLGALASADVLLDTPGFSGGNSSFDAIAVGAPIVTWRGSMLRGRQTAAMLNIVGLPAFVSESDDDYVRSAVEIASDTRQQRDLRARLISGGDALFDDIGAARALEHTLLKLVT